MNAPVKNPPVTFAEAFLKLQAAIRPAIKDSVNPAFKSKYADLASVWEAVREPLQDNGFAVIQKPDFEGETMWLETTLMHISGAEIKARYPLKPVRPDPQGFGSAISYARRYSLSAMLGVIQEDDDGQAASTPSKPAQQAAPTQDQDVTDGVANWVATQKAAIAKAASLPALYAWLENIAGAGATLTDPSTGSVLDRLKRKSPEAYGVVVAAWNARLMEINRKDSK